MRARLKYWLVIVSGAFVAGAVLTAGSTFAVGQQSKKPEPPEPLQLEDPLEPLDPANPRTPQEEDHLKAMALVGAAEVKQKRGENEQAIRLLQRAHRLDPKSSNILQGIVQLTFQLQRPGELERYALKAVELKPENPLLVQRLAIELSGKGEDARALKLYEALVKLETPDEKKTPRHVMIVIEMGRLYFATEQYKKSAAAFEEVLDALENAEQFNLSAEQRGAILGDAAKTYTEFGDSFLEAGKTDEALSAYRTAFQVSRDKAGFAFQQARVETANEEFDQALEHLDAYFESKATSRGAEPYALLAEVLDAADRSDQLMPKLEALHKADAENAFLARYLADRYAAADKPDEAAKLYRVALADERAAERSPELVTAARRGLAAVLRNGGKHGELLELLGEVAGADGDLSDLEEETEAIAADKKLTGALLEEAAKRQEDEALGYGGQLAAALVALEAKRLNDAAKYFDLAIRSKPDNAGEIIMTWGLGLLLAEENDRAAEVLQRGIDDLVIEESNPVLHYYLAMALEFDGQTDKALEAAKHAVSLNEDNPRLESRAAWVLYHAGRYDEARKAYEALVEKYDDVRSSADVRQSVREARLVLSNIAVAQKDMVEGEEWLEQVLDEFPEDTGAMNDLGYLWADQSKNLHRALPMVEKAVAAEPDNAAYQDSLGWALFRMGRVEEAVKHLENAVKGDDSPDGVILEHLGDAYHAAGKVDQARSTWQRALESFDEKTDQEEIERTKKKLGALGDK